MKNIFKAFCIMMLVTLITTMTATFAEKFIIDIQISDLQPYEEPIEEQQMLGRSLFHVYQGGTGAETFAAGECLVGNGTDPVTTQACGGGSSITGTEGQIVYMNGANTAIGTSSLIISSDGKIGIGDPTMSGILNIKGNSASMYVHSNGDAIVTSGDFYFDPANSLFLKAGGGVRLVADSGGNIGIGGETTPDATLEIATADTNGYLMVSSAATEDGDIFIIDENGNVGIGTTNPGAELDIAGSVDISNTNSQLDIIESDTGKTWRVEVSNNDFFFTEAGAAERLILQAGGNVGIGTTSPAYELDINGNIGLTGDINMLDDQYIGGLGTSNARTEFTVDNSGMIKTYGNYYDVYNSYFRLKTATLEASNNINVYGGSSKNLSFWANGASAGTPLNNSSILKMSSRYWDTTDLRGEDSYFYIKSEINSDLPTTVINFSFADTNSYSDITALSMLNTGEIGFGDTDPDSHVEIAGTLGDGYLMVSSADTEDGDIFIVDENGKMGINKQNPDYYIDVEGSSNLMKLKSTSAGIGSLVSLDDAGGGDGRAFDIQCRHYGGECFRIAYPQGHSAPGMNITGGSGDGLLIQKSSGYTNNFMEMKVDSMDQIVFASSSSYFLGDLGVGTSTPETKLHVNGTSTVEGYALVGKVLHAFGGFEDAGETLTCDADTWTFITNATNDLWEGMEADGVTMVDDEMVISRSGDYSGMVTVTLSASTGKDFHFRIYNTTQSKVEGYSLGISTTGAGNKMGLSVPIYIEANAGDVLQLQLNSTDGTDPVVNDSIFYVNYLHE